MNGFCYQSSEVVAKVGVIMLHSYAHTEPGIFVILMIIENSMWHAGLLCLFCTCAYFIIFIPYAYGTILYYYALTGRFLQRYLRSCSKGVALQYILHSDLRPGSSNSQGTTTEIPVGEKSSCLLAGQESTSRFT